MCSLVQGTSSPTPTPWDLGTLTRTHPLKVESAAASVLVTLLGAMIKHLTRSSLRDEGFFWLLV